MSAGRDKDATEFLPDALSVRDAVLPWAARHAILWMCCGFLVFLLWACLGQVDIIVSANGKVVSDHPTIVMKPLERTVIKKILVAVGDRVREGQELVLFDPVFSRSDRDRLKAEEQTCQARYDRLLAEFEDREYLPPTDGNAEARVQQEVFKSRRQFHADRVAYFTHEMERIEKSSQSVKENLSLQRKRLKGFLEIEALILKGHARGSTSHREFIESQIARRQMEAEISDKENTIHVLDSELLAKKAEYNAFLRDWRINIAEEMVKAESALTNARKELAKAEQMTSYVALRAPEEAVVHDIGPLSVGSAVREAETLLTLVPLGGILEIEAEIRADDIGKVHEGDSVRVKITAFPFQKYGTLAGEVRVISEDAFQKQPEREGPATGAATGACYRARIRLTGEESAHYKLLSRLIPGMESQAEIKVGTRSIISYFLNPLIKSLDEAIREP
ncbi:MAG: HlyD family type I secretion periplasmic adaptor subunit [Desulfovibrio sp.]|nr:HlyD family type I secretion periplasmic adaptor subunit [Desulfovibrio sp.]